MLQSAFNVFSKIASFLNNTCTKKLYTFGEKLSLSNNVNTFFWLFRIKMTDQNKMVSPSRSSDILYNKKRTDVHSVHLTLHFSFGKFKRKITIFFSVTFTGFW